MASGSKRVIYAALAGNAGITVTKFIASAVTGSSAMFAEAIHSVVDTGNQLLLLWGLKQARKPADEQFPLGYGKEVYFWTFMVSILIFAVGAGVSLYEGIVHLIHPREVGHAGVNYIVLAIAAVFEGGAWWIAWRGFRASKGKHGYIRAIHRGKDPTMFVVLLEDFRRPNGTARGVLWHLAGADYRGAHTLTPARRSSSGCCWGRSRAGWRGSRRGC